ncbi:lactate racemase domain-containing protein [Solidesulfovibrio sp.]|uniref:lactate racemase domain-containing protein n=1 Tax=Solidesulfovibrio sp. TaxID=2910990 RepID=UPI002B1F6BF8|nr:lactate racemase domain-containing protein [Solidesulfovibrio sp.]MEA5087835.1 lactate racemase domain-containing protein [Solidesulfovibrio sp.]
MQDVLLDYGDTKMRVELPDGATVLRLAEVDTDPPAVDPAEATRRALAKPLGTPPLRELAKPGQKVVIGFPDRVKGGAGPLCHRKVAIPIIVEEFLAAGVRLEDITLLCAPGLHRHNTLEEWNWYLGKKIVDMFWPDRLLNHDAESPDIVDLGRDGMGNIVQVSRLLAEADLPIVVGHCAGNPYGGFSGGYKMLVTGHTTWRCISSHHCPKTMYRDDWLGASPHSHQRHQFRSIGEAIEQGIGKKIFGVDAVIGKRAQVLDVQAGLLGEIEKATWPMAEKRTNYAIDMAEPADVLIMGLPRNFHYGPGMGTNPILMSLAIGGQLSRCWGAFREGGVIIAVSVCDGWFNANWFPSYEETYEALQKYCTPAEFLASQDADALAAHPEYCYKYSNYNTYHPYHAMSMISGGSVPALRTSAVYVAGAKAPRFARGMGFTPTATFEEAMARAKRHVGSNPRILCTPDCFTGGMGVHLHLKK